MLPRSEQVPSTTIELAPSDTDLCSPLRSYWDIVNKRRWTILTALLVVLTLVTIYSFKTRPIYKATARVEIDAETPPLQSINELYQNSLSDETFLQTQVRVLESDNLVWQTIQKLKLAENPHFASGLAAKEAPGSATSEGTLIREFRQHLTVALALIMAGALGNCYDRLAYGHVRDFVHFHVDAIGFDWAIFNFADNMLVIGAVTLVFYAMRPDDRASRAKSEPVEAHAAL